LRIRQALIDLAKINLGNNGKSTDRLSVRHYRIILPGFPAAEQPHSTSLLWPLFHRRFLGAALAYRPQ
jgi:hypothetical protein